MDACVDWTVAASHLSSFCFRRSCVSIDTLVVTDIALVLAVNGFVVNRGKVESMSLESNN